MPTPPKNRICLWYDGDAEEAAHILRQHLPRHIRRRRPSRAPGDYPAGKRRGRANGRVHGDGHPLPRPQRRPGVPARRGLLVPSRHRRPGRDRSLLERHRRQRRQGKRLRLVQRQMGPVVADHAHRPLRRDHASRSRRRQTRLRRDDADDENRRRRHRSRLPRRLRFGESQSNGRHWHPASAEAPKEAARRLACNKPGGEGGLWAVVDVGRALASHWRGASEKCRKRLHAVWRARSMKGAACWLWLMGAVYPLHTGDTPVASGSLPVL